MIFNKVISLLRKGVYPYEYMDDWEKFNKTALPEKEEFYRNLNYRCRSHACKKNFIL